MGRRVHHMSVNVGTVSPAPHVQARARINHLKSIGQLIASLATRACTMNISCRLPISIPATSMVVKPDPGRSRQFGSS